MQEGPSQRQLKVAELIRIALIEVLKKGKAPDPRLFDANVTITSVNVSADLKNASCYVLPFASNMKEEDLMEALENSKYHLRALVTQKINLKYSPELRFVYDHGTENSNKVEEILSSLSTRNNK